MSRLTRREDSVFTPTSQLRTVPLLLLLLLLSARCWHSDTSIRQTPREQVNPTRTAILFRYYVTGPPCLHYIHLILLNTRFVDNKTLNNFLVIQVFVVNKFVLYLVWNFCFLWKSQNIGDTKVLINNKMFFFVRPWIFIIIVW